MKQRSALFLWFLLSWGLVVATRYPELNQIVLKGLIPFIFLYFILTEQKIVFHNKPLNFYIIFFIWCSASVLYTVNNQMTLGYLQTIIGNIIIWYSAYRLSIQIKSQWIALFILGSAFLFHALMGLLTPVEIIENAGYGRALGLFSNSNALGFSMWYGIVIFIFFLLDADNKVLRIVFLLSIFLFLSVLLSSGSRKTALAFLVLVGVLVFYLSKGRFRWTFLSILALGFLTYDIIADFIINQTVLGARLEGGTLEEGAATRGDLVKEGLSFFVEYPLLGIGLGSFTAYSSSGLMSHNDYIEILSSTGLIGFLLYMPIFWFFFRDSGRLLAFKTSFKFAVVMRAFLIGYMFLGMGRPAFLDPVAILIFGFFYSLCLRQLNEIKNFKYQVTKNETYASLSDQQHA